jgi:hypothetical protein
MSGTKWVWMAVAMTGLGLYPIAASGQGQPALNLASKGVAVKGYDVVAYETEGAPVKGRVEFEYRWQGGVWRFASAANRDRFAASPERFAPQFGGYCAWAVSRGYTADVDPEAWRIVDGKLYLNYSRRVQRMWEQDVPGNIAKGAANWPGVLAR